MIVQGLVDAHNHFLECLQGWPRSVRDARVFTYSNLYKKLHTETWFPINQ